MRASLLSLRITHREQDRGRLAGISTVRKSRPVDWDFDRFTSKYKDVPGSIP